MKTFKHFILLTLLATIVLGCNSEKKDWKATQEEGTIDAYIEYCEKYPDSEHKAEIKDFLTEYIEDNKNEMYVLYNNFRLREEPNLDAEIVEKMEANTKVEFFESNRDYQKIEINGYTANIDWYDVKTEDGKSGWVYGAGLAYSDEMFKACQLFMEQFPDESLIPLRFCETNYWNEITTQEDEIDNFIEHKNLFPNGIYAFAAIEEIINKNFSVLSIDKFERIEISKDYEKIIFPGNLFIPTHPYKTDIDIDVLDSEFKIPDNEVQELINKTDSIVSPNYDELGERNYNYYGKLIIFNADYYALTLITSDGVDFSEIILIFKNNNFTSIEFLCATAETFCVVGSLFKDEQGKIYLRQIEFANMIEYGDENYVFDFQKGTFVETNLDNIITSFKLKTRKEFLEESEVAVKNYKNKVDSITESISFLERSKKLEIEELLDSAGNKLCLLQRYYNDGELVKILLKLKHPEGNDYLEKIVYLNNNKLIYCFEYSENPGNPDGETKRIWISGNTIVDIISTDESYAPPTHDILIVGDLKEIINIDSEEKLIEHFYKWEKQLDFR